jgi:DNA-binding GntR family transcriptional regulator
MGLSESFLNTILHADGSTTVEWPMAGISLTETKRNGAEGTTSDEVYEKLRLAIVTGEIRPNAPLIEVDLANALKVSRTPIRESLQRLAADQLIVPRKRGWAVREYSALEIQESYELRAALEGYAAGLAAERASDEDITAIAAIQKLRDVETNPSHEFRVTTNRQFHDRIIHAARNGRLADAIYRSGRFYFNEQIAANTTRSDFASNQADHTRIVTALQARDSDAAEKAMRTHILNTYRAFQRYGAA